jgi:hypothetical protein
MANRISIDSNEIEWQPAAEVFPGYALDTDDPDAGISVKVLRAPEDGGGCWHCLLRFRPPAGKAIRITAIAQSDEEVFMLTGDRYGQYGCNPKGLRHGQTITEDTTALVHYHDAPDDVLRAEVIERAAS